MSTAFILAILAAMQVQRLCVQTQWSTGCAQCSQFPSTRGSACMLSNVPSSKKKQTCTCFKMFSTILGCATSITVFTSRLTRHIVSYRYIARVSSPFLSSCHCQCLCSSFTPLCAPTFSFFRSSRSPSCSNSSISTEAVPLRNHRHQSNGPEPPDPILLFPIRSVSRKPV